MSRPDRDEVLTLDDVLVGLDGDEEDRLPSGTATVYRVATDAQYTASTLATVDENGVLRTLDGRRSVFDSERCEVLGVER